MAQLPRPARYLVCPGDSATKFRKRFDCAPGWVKLSANDWQPTDVQRGSPTWWTRACYNAHLTSAHTHSRAAATRELRGQPCGIMLPENTCPSAKNVAWMKNNLKMCCRVSKPLCLSRQMFADLGITVFATVLPLLILYYVGRPVQQGFFCDDDELKYPYVGETISGLAVIAATLSAPLVVVILAEVSLRISGGYGPGSDGRQRCSLGCAVRAYGVYFHGYLIMNFLIQLLKLTTGKLRPVFMDLCRPDLVESNCTGYIREYRCTNEEASPSLLLEARQSFPSGHAALSFYCSVFLALYLEERLTVMCSRLLKITLQAAMLMTSVWCSATRVSDHMHHEQDVVAGVVMGVLLALAMFYKVFRPCLWLQDEAPGTCAARDANVNHADVDLEVGEPETPTPLLSKNGILISSSTGMHIGPFRLQGDKTQGGECI